MAQAADPTSPTSTPRIRTAAGRLPGLPDVVVGHAHATGGGWASGCTVVLPPPRTVGGVAVGGGAPGTRETDALAPGTLVSTVDAVVLSGGSAYGLAVADGVAAWCEEVGRGFLVSGPGVAEVRVPIVPAAVVFDLGRGGDPGARPTAAFGRAACRATEALADPGADDVPVPEGPVGAGTGARVSGGTAPGGVGVAGRVVPGVAGATWAVAAVVVANAAGTPLGVTPAATAPAAPPAGPPAGPPATPDPGGGPGLLHTTLAVVVTDALLDTAAATRLAGAAQAGLARAVDPSHTLVDGDVVFALATGTAPVPVEVRDRVALESACADALTLAFARAVAPPPGDRAHPAPAGADGPGPAGGTMTR